MPRPQPTVTARMCYGMRRPPWLERKLLTRAPVLIFNERAKSGASHRWKLGARVEHAPTFDNVLCRTSPRTDVPQLELSAEEMRYLEKPLLPEQMLPSPLHVKLLPYIIQSIGGGTMTEQDIAAAMVEILEGVETERDLTDRLNAFAAHFGG